MHIARISGNACNHGCMSQKVCVCGDCLFLGNFQRNDLFVRAYVCTYDCVLASVGHQPAAANIFKSLHISAGNFNIKNRCFLYFQLYVYSIGYLWR